MTTTEPLTEREQQALEQMREAQEQGSTLKDYAAKIGLDVRQLYELRRRLVWAAAVESQARIGCTAQAAASRAPDRRHLTILGWLGVVTCWCNHAIYQLIPAPDSWRSQPTE
jgi:hypothetical protein